MATDKGKTTVTEANTKTVKAATKTKTVQKPRASITESVKKKPEAKPEPKKKGRKPWVPEYEKIEQWSLQGLNDKSIAALCRISTAEFCKKKTQLPQLKAALDYGRAKGEAAVSSVLLQMALKGDKDMIKTYLGRRCGWSETVINKNIDLSAIDNMTPEELDELERSLGI